MGLTSLMSHPFPETAITNGPGFFPGIYPQDSVGRRHLPLSPRESSTEAQQGTDRATSHRGHTQLTALSKLRHRSLAFLACEPPHEAWTSSQHGGQIPGGSFGQAALPLMAQPWESHSVPLPLYFQGKRCRCLPIEGSGLITAATGVTL